MLKVSLLFLAVLICLNGFAQELNPRFKNGEIRKYQIRSSTKSPAQGTYEIFNTIKEVIAIKVTGTESNSIAFEWTYLNVIFIDSVPQYNPVMDLMNTLTQDLTVKYITNTKGVIQSVTNYKEISTKIKQRTEAVIENMSKDKGINSSLIESTKFQFQMMFSTEQQINDIVINDIFKFHELYGYSLTPKSLIRITDPPSDKFELHIVSHKNNQHQFEGALIGYPSGEKKGYRIYKFDPSYWPIKFTFRSDPNNPMPISQFYEIQAVNN